MTNGHPMNSQHSYYDCRNFQLITTKSGRYTANPTKLWSFCASKPKNSSEWILGERKSQFMNNKILFIKHSTIKRNVALDFSLLIFSRVHFPLFSVSHPALAPRVLCRSLRRCFPSQARDSFVSGELYHFIAIMFIILAEHEFLRRSQRVGGWCACLQTFNKVAKRFESVGSNPTGAEIHLTQFWAANFSRLPVAEEKWKVI